MPSLSAAPHALRDNATETVRGILVVAVAYVFMTAGDVAAKWALSVGVAAIMIGRGVAGSITIATLARVEGDLRRLVPVRRRMVALRSVLHATVSISWYMAWQVAPMADVYAVGFAAPLIMTLLAIPMLGERIRWRRVLSTLLGFGGVLVMVQPGSALWHPVMLVLVPGIVGTAISRNMTRQLSTTETAECLTFWLMVAHVPAGVAMLAAGFPGAGTPTWDVWAALGVVGVLNASAHWLMARAYALAPVSALAPYEYTMLLWGGLAGWAVFHEVPVWSTIAGAVIVAAAGLYNLHRERLARRTPCS